jgi:hypothetical protein
MKLKLLTSTLELIEREFAEAVARGDYDAAEGWLATAAHVKAREAIEPRPGLLAEALRARRVLR